VRALCPFHHTHGMVHRVKQKPGLFPVADSRIAGYLGPPLTAGQVPGTGADVMYACHSSDILTRNLGSNDMVPSHAAVHLASTCSSESARADPTYCRKLTGTSPTQICLGTTTSRHRAAEAARNDKDSARTLKRLSQLTNQANPVSTGASCRNMCKFELHR
jgi:hypothetical protein